ncbi:MAG: antitoxin VapB [Lentisphaeria bacterium]|jgi:antitoxin VapB
MMITQIAKIFMNGRSQAVRLPKEFRFDCDEVYITKQGDKIIISPSKPTWDDFFFRIQLLTKTTLKITTK